jgi:hypothetical protein
MLFQEVTLAPTPPVFPVPRSRFLPLRPVNIIPLFLKGRGILDKWKEFPTRGSLLGVDGLKTDSRALRF